MNKYQYMSISCKYRKRKNNKIKSVFYIKYYVLKESS